MNWNANIAYAVGLITTDGNLSKDGRHMVFVSKDITLVETLKKCLNLKNKISSKTSGYSKRKGRYYFVQFGNVKFYKELIAIGLSPNKSKNIRELKIPKKYFADFLRGHLDGDGTLRIYDDSAYPKSQRLYTSFMSASKKHILWLRGQIRKYYRILGKIRAVPRAWIVIYSKNESIILLPKLYYKNSLPCLERKKRIIANYI